MERLLRMAPSQFPEIELMIRLPAHHPPGLPVYLARLPPARLSMLENFPKSPRDIRARRLSILASRLSYRVRLTRIVISTPPACAGRFPEKNRSLIGSGPLTRRNRNFRRRITSSRSMKDSWRQNNSARQRSQV